jgi:hypothetical protein
MPEHALSAPDGADSAPPGPTMPTTRPANSRHQQNAQPGSPSPAQTVNRQDGAFVIHEEGQLNVMLWWPSLFKKVWL